MEFGEKQERPLVKLNEGVGEESKSGAAYNVSKKIRGSVRYHSTQDKESDIKGENDGRFAADSQFSSKEAPPESELVPACFAKSKMYRGWIVFDDDDYAQ